MNVFDPLIHHASPAILLMWTLLLGLLGGITVVGCCRSVSYLRRRAVSQHDRVEALAIQRMLKFVGVGTGRYLRRESAPVVEVQLLRCQHCPNPQACEGFLAGDRSSHPIEFCPNYGQLLRLSSKPPEPAQSAEPDCRAVGRGQG